MSLVRFYSFAGALTSNGPVLRHPYLAREGVEVNGHKAATTTLELTAHTATKLVRVEIENGSVVALECNPPNRAAQADALSPRYMGPVTFEAGPGWTFSVLEIG